jgi:DNA invertase Pin-like site-specific DNA recombinase
MSVSDTSSKVSADHLRRDAYLYVRQSSLHQVMNNTESSRRQYDLRGRAIALGWPLERVIVIDIDQGISGATSADREGFQRLVADVSLGKAGIVLGLECSRLARNNADWHRLLELCALTSTLICDEDGLYDPSTINDRLLLGLKGAMSEAELHILRSRMRGGILSKARRGELRTPLPVGLVYDPLGKVTLDPDTAVQGALRHLFECFQRTGSARAVVKEFAAQQLSFPQRIRSGPRKGEIVWAALDHYRVLQVLHNPRYAGAFSFGRKQAQYVNGKTSYLRMPRERWIAFIQDAHAGYISFKQWEANQAALLANAQARGQQRRASPPREGPALLQGLIVCGRCGGRMTVRYHQRRGQLLPDYLCQKESVERATESTCQVIPGTAVDDAVASLLLDTLTPVALEVALSVAADLEQRATEADQLRLRHVERARYEAGLARRRYLAVDPDNRLVADALEADTGTKSCAASPKPRMVTNARTRTATDTSASSSREGDGARQRLPATLERSRNAPTRAQTHGPPADRRHHPQPRPADHRPRTPQGRADAHADPADPAAVLGSSQGPSRHGQADRPTARRPHRRRDRPAAQSG